MNGLLTQKPGREPVPGETKLFLLEERVSANGNAWTKVKNATAEQGGVPYRVVSVKPTGRTDQYGNISMNIEIEPSPSDGAPAPQIATQRTFTPPMGDDRSNRIERQHSQEMALRYFSQRGGLKGGAEGREELRMMIDWFQVDVSRMPAPPQAKKEDLRREEDPGDIAGEEQPPYEEESF